MIIDSASLPLLVIARRSARSTYKIASIFLITSLVS
jgi:hypothetical protein